jgi:hypothetical protein
MWTRSGLCAAVLAAACTVSNVADAQVLMQRDVSLAMALTIATTASAECGAITSIAVIDRAGRIKILLQGDGGSPTIWSSRAARLTPRARSGCRPRPGRSGPRRPIKASGC